MLKLKLEMVYHGLPMDDAKAKYMELTSNEPEVPPPVVEPPKRRRRVVAKQPKAT